MAASRKKKSSSFIPLIFTLGVLGWGFFAIDRLTSTTNDENFQNIKITQPRVHKRKDSWSFRKKIADWLLGDTKDTSKKKVTYKTKLNSTKKRQLKIINEEELSRDRLQENSFQNDKVYLYYYSIGANESLYLKKFLVDIKETKSLELKIKRIINEIIAGPNFNQKIRNSNSIDSFPVKPKLISVSIDRNIVQLNFNEDFGVGVSFQTLKYQIHQLYKASTQIAGLDSIQILINNKRVKHIGGDGLVLPSLINRQNVALIF